MVTITKKHTAEELGWIGYVVQDSIGKESCIVAASDAHSKFTSEKRAWVEWIATGY